MTLTPLITVIYLGGLGLASTIEKMLLRVKTKTLGFAIPFSIIATLAIIYGVFEGVVIAETIFLVFFHEFQSIGQIIFAILFALFAGGFFGAAAAFNIHNLNNIYSIIILLATLFFLWIGIWKARETVQWQQRINSNTLS